MNSLNQNILLEKYDDNKLALLDLLAKYIEEVSKNINITAIRDYNSIIEKHIVDSISINQLDGFNDFKCSNNVLDIGTGGGFPGLVLAILYPELNIYLLDSRRKKIEVIDKFIEANSISNVQTIWDRAESESFLKNYSDFFDVCTARAVADTKILLDYSHACLRISGDLYVYKSLKSQVYDMGIINNDVRFRIKDNHRYKIGEDERIIYHITKTL